jgi:hypothetical protein
MNNETTVNVVPTAISVSSVPRKQRRTIPAAKSRGQGNFAGTTTDPVQSILKIYRHLWLND